MRADLIEHVRMIVRAFYEAETGAEAVRIGRLYESALGLLTPEEHIFIMRERSSVREGIEREREAKL